MKNLTETIARLFELDAKRTQGDWECELYNNSQGQVNAEMDAVCVNRFCYADEGAENLRFIAAAPTMMQVIRHQQEVIERLKTGLRVAAECLSIAGDWHAPTHYDITLPDGWQDVKDADSIEPEWAALYLLVPKLEQTLAAIEAGKE